jgi:hypothetical protein
MNKEKIILIFAIILLFVINYSFLDRLVVNFLDEKEYVEVERVIDGDTFVVGEESVRLLGINSPEKGGKYYEEAKKFLEGLILGTNVQLEYGQPKYDKYYRALAFVFVGNTNINIELVENGFANYYFYSGGGKYSEDLVGAWERCLEKNVNLCERSVDVCASCVFIESDSIVNDCNFDCDISNWKIHGEGRKKFIFPEQIIGPGEKADFEIDLSNSGGSLFLRDDEGLLVLWKEY